MTAVIRLADARRNASSSSKSSIRWSFTGVHVDWMTNTSPPRTLSAISTITSPSLKRRTSARPSDTSRTWQTSATSGRFELPAKTWISSLTNRSPSIAAKLGGKDSNLRYRIQSPGPYQLGDRPSIVPSSLRHQLDRGDAVQPAYHASPRARRSQLVRRRPRVVPALPQTEQCRPASGHQNALCAQRPEPLFDRSQCRLKMKSRRFEVVVQHLAQRLLTWSGSRDSTG